MARGDGDGGAEMPAGEVVNYRGKRQAGARIRTADLLITNQLLYQLSYASVRGVAAAGAGRGKRYSESGGVGEARVQRLRSRS